MSVVPVSEAERVALQALRRAGAPEEAARTQVGLLLEAELRGVPSHGLLRLPRLIRRIHNGVANPAATGQHEWRAPGMLSVNGENGLGPVVALAALEAVKPRARELGVAVAAISNSNHLGMLAWYAEQVAADGLALIALTTSEALVHPWGGRRALVGTNPIAVGAPTGGRPFVMDTATGVVSMGKIHDHANRGAPLEPGWALDAEGRPTTNAEAAKAGAIAPFGGAKGYALGLAFELLVAGLTGSALGDAVKGTLDDDAVCNKGDLFIVLDAGLAAGEGRLAAYLDLIRESPPAEGFDTVRIPGDRAHQVRAGRLESGLPIADEVWLQLQALAEGAVHEETVP
ncbi:Ldh family oxidoreductase [Phenylobacterium deserti]|uniref:Ldh family oxidoreductase n=1 Tax=Phenylobacterium deserti TaxID=1914756 RepID=A0A328A8G3_9CAUL|nr:Ldh family oxidoreductase [Phenylobacterium deserti]RAK50759.1 Ldh family oxidoreductase [Phenylobacterium deserti]